MFEDLLQEFVTQILVPPFGESLLQMGFELLPEFHLHKLKNTEEFELNPRPDRKVGKKRSMLTMKNLILGTRQVLFRLML